MKLRHPERGMCKTCGGPTERGGFFYCKPCYAKSRREPYSGPTNNLPKPTWKKQTTVLTTLNHAPRERTCRRCPNHIQKPYHYCAACYSRLPDHLKARERESWQKVPHN